MLFIGYILSLYIATFKLFTGDYELRRRFARRGVELFFKMLFDDNFIHGDLHPGNMCVIGIDENGTLNWKR